MAVTGAWKGRAVQAEGYTGAMRWGTGINPIHAKRDPQRHPDITREPLGATEWSGAVPEEILGPLQWGYGYDDQFYAGEEYRYLVEDHPNWGEDSAGRPDRAGVIQQPGAYPQPEGWPSWGPHWDDNPVDGFPVAGPPGGAAVRSYSDGLDAERRRAMAVPTPGVSGGWLNKARQEQNEAVTSAPAQYEITTSMRQVHGVMANDRAARRGTDDPRATITTRTAGMKVKQFAASFGMGGGPGAPDMRPCSQDLMYRPFYFRSAGLPPAEAHTWNEMEQRQPLQRVIPPDPYQGDYAGSAQGNVAGSYVQGPDFGYSDGDYIGGM